MNSENTQVIEKKPDIVEITRDLLKKRNYTVSLAKIAADLGVNKEWLQVFQTGRIKDPSASKIIKLYEYLSGNTLNIK